MDKIKDNIEIRSYTSWFGVVICVTWTFLPWIHVVSYMYQPQSPDRILLLFLCILYRNCHVLAVWCCVRISECMYMERGLWLTKSFLDAKKRQMIMSFDEKYGIPWGFPFVLPFGLYDAMRCNYQGFIYQKWYCIGWLFIVSESKISDVPNNNSENNR